MWRCPIPDFVNEARSKPLWIQFNCVRRRKVYESHHDTLPLDDFFYSSYYMEDKLFRSFMSGPSAWPAWLGGSHRSWAPWLGGIWGGVGCEKPPWEAPCLGAALSSVPGPGLCWSPGWVSQSCSPGVSDCLVALCHQWPSLPCPKPNLLLCFLIFSN